jgi:hypothetical protein
MNFGIIFTKFKGNEIYVFIEPPYISFPFREMLNATLLFIVSSGLMSHTNTSMQ